MPAAGLKHRAEDFIRQRLTLKALPFRPDISLYSPIPQSGLTGWLVGEAHDEVPPYWAYAWGGGAVLALHLLDHPERVIGRTVLDFGAGSGLVGIAAARAGAAKVWALDPDPVAQAALRLNAEANQVDLPLWTGAGLPHVDVILAGDVFYLPEIVQRTMPLLAGAAAGGTEVLVGDPFRRDLPLDHLTLLAEYQVPDMGGNGPVRAGIFALKS